MTVGQNIRALRRQRRWSQEDVAKKLNISIAALSKIETGITDINLSRLLQISSIFNISLSSLLMINDVHVEPLTPQELVYQQLHNRDAEVIGLQNKIIALYEELRTAKGYTFSANGNRHSTASYNTVNKP